MKKGNILNPQLSKIIASMGHTDGLVIADCGLPIPDVAERVDLALSEHIPSFIQTLEVVLRELEVESIVLAEEIKTFNPSLCEVLLEKFSSKPVTWVDHDTFKQLTKEAKAVVRTGECSPYANIILKSGVIF